jgi:hypothetical protein
MKKWRVSLDRPGAGWTTIVEADSKDTAMVIASWRYRENPDTAYEVSDRDILSQALVELDREHQSAMDKLLEKHNDKVNKLMRDQAKERERIILA